MGDSFNKLISMSRPQPLAVKVLLRIMRMRGRRIRVTGGNIFFVR
jgi:hypothetical protein